jgi:hypothetical protein
MSNIAGIFLQIAGTIMAKTAVLHEPTLIQKLTIHRHDGPFHARKPRSCRASEALPIYAVISASFAWQALRTV